MPSPMPWELESTICRSNRKTSIGPSRTKRKKTRLKPSLSNFLNFSSNIQKPLLTGVTLRSVVARVFGGLRESKFEELPRYNDHRLSRRFAAFFSEYRFRVGAGR